MDKAVIVNISYLQLIIGVIIPLVTGIVVKWHASSQVKAVANIILVAVAGAVTTVISNQGSLVPKEFVAGILTTAIASWSSYAGFYKPSGVTNKVQLATANFGVGGPAPTAPPTAQAA